MKISLSKSNVRQLVFMLDDHYRMDAKYDDDEDKMWSDFDCINIIRDLLSANRHRDEYGLIDVSEATVLWLSVVFEMMFSNEEKSNRRLSDITLNALNESVPNMMHQEINDSLNEIY